MMKHIIHKIHPAYRPILLGFLVFLIFNLSLTIVVTCSTLNQRFNFSYGNFLPTKLELLSRNHPKQLDVLFLGTSQTNNGFITSVFEQAAHRPINSFNLGLPNNRYDIMQAYLDYHIHQYGAPKLVLIELSPSIQEVNSYYYYLPALYYRTLIERMPQHTAQFLNYPYLAWNVKKEILLSSLSSLHQYRFTFSPLNILNKGVHQIQAISRRTDVVANAAIPANQPASSSKDEMVIQPEMTQKGWSPHQQSEHMKTPQGVTLSVEEAKKYYIDQQKNVRFDKLRALLSYCHQQKIPVVLVSWPNHPEFLKVFQQSPLNQKYQKGLTDLLAEESVPMLNLNAYLPQHKAEVEKHFFADPRHLTPTGAQYFSQVLANEVLNGDFSQKKFKTP